MATSTARGTEAAMTISVKRLEIVCSPSRSARSLARSESRIDDHKGYTTELSIGLGGQDETVRYRQPQPILDFFQRRRFPPTSRTPLDPTSDSDAANRVMSCSCPVAI